MKTHLPLRYRLSLLHLLLLVILLSLFSYVIFINTKNYLIQNTAVRLRAQAKPIIEKWLHADTWSSDYLQKNAQSLLEDLISRDTSVLILDKTGKVVAAEKGPGKTTDLVLLNMYYKRSLSGNNEINYIVEGETGFFLVVLIPLRNSSAPHDIIGVVCLSTPLSPLEKILARQKLILFAGILLIIVAGALIGFWITAVSLRELNDMVETCNQIAGGDLSKRINLPGKNDEIGQLAKAFDNMITRIEELFENQTRFVANAAHELRTPLAALQGSLEVLMRGAQDDPDSFLRLTQGMYREVIRLSRMSEQLLDLTKVTRLNDIHKVPLNIKDTVNDFVQYARVITEGRRIVITGDSGLEVSVDPDSFKQILFNLTDNAIQHTAADGTIEFSWEISGSDIHIHIANDGDGIPPVDLPHVFEPFYRGDSSRARTHGGTGLGLTIVKTLVEANGGSITVKSISGRKTVFTLHFPLFKSE